MCRGSWVAGGTDFLGRNPSAVTHAAYPASYKPRYFAMTDRCIVPATCRAHMIFSHVVAPKPRSPALSLKQAGTRLLGITIPTCSRNGENVAPVDPCYLASDNTWPRISEIEPVTRA